MVVVWRITERCNLSCKFCAFDKELSRPRHDADSQTILRFGSVLAEYQKTRGEPVLVSWLGGEPLLWPPLTDISRAYREQFGLRLSTTTNGTTLGSATVRRHLLDHYAELTVSLDGIGALHDNLRGWPGGFASLRDNVGLLVKEKRARGKGPVLRANILLMHQTIAGFEELCAELSRWGIEEITFNQLGGNDRPEFFPAHRLQPEDAAWLSDHVPRLQRELAARGVRLHGGSGYLRRIRATSVGEPLPVADCAPGRKFLFINEAGLISPCSFTNAVYGIPVGETRSLDDLESVPKRFARQRLQSRATACEDCHSTQVFEKFAA